MNTEHTDKVLGELIGLARACETNLKTENTDAVITETLAVCATKHGIPEESLENILERIRKEKNAVAPNCATCASPCGNTAAYDLKQLQSEKKEIQEVKWQLLAEICRTALLIRQGNMPVKEQKKCVDLFYQILSVVSYELKNEVYLPILAEIKTILGGIKDE